VTAHEFYKCHYNVVLHVVMSYVSFCCLTKSIQHCFYNCIHVLSTDWPRLFIHGVPLILMISNRMTVSIGIQLFIGLCVLLQLLHFVCNYTSIIWQLLMNIIFFCACYLLHYIVYSIPGTSSDLDEFDQWFSHCAPQDLSEIFHIQ
jgi:hypothetical protein